MARQNNQMPGFVAGVESGLDYLAMEPSPFQFWRAVSFRALFISPPLRCNMLFLPRMGPLARSLGRRQPAASQPASQKRSTSLAAPCGRILAVVPVLPDWGKSHQLGDFENQIVTKNCLWGWGNFGGQKVSAKILYKIGKMA